MTTIVDFLHARYNEIEASAKAAGWATADAWALTDGCNLTDGAGNDIRVDTDPRDDDSYGSHADRIATITRHLARHDPEYALRLVEAHRAILTETAPVVADGGDGDYRLERVLKHLALPFAHHPDYREEWKP